MTKVSPPKTDTKQKNTPSADLFSFSKEDQKTVKAILSRYPKDHKESAVMPLLYLAQARNEGWLPQPAINHVAEVLDMPLIRVMEVASFYTMYHLSPVGRHHIQVCVTTPCWLRGSDDLVRVCEKKLGLQNHDVTPDGTFSFEKVECLGACANAPVVQINEDYYEDLTAARLEEIVDLLAKGETPPLGSQTGRQCSAPEIFLSNVNKSPSKQKSSQETQNAKG